MTLKFVEPSAVAPTMNILLYGPGGTGKTVNACSAPGPILVGNAEGESALRFARGKWGDDKIHEKAITCAKDLDDIFLHVREGCEEKTLVIDSVGEIYQRLVEELAGSGRASLQNYGDVNTKIERFVRAVKDLPINVVLIAHEQLDEDDGASIKRPATGGKKLPEKLVAAVDVVGYCAVLPESEDAPRRYVAQLVEANGRRAKDRSGSLGKLRDINLSEWIPTAVEAMSGAQQQLAPEPEAAPAEEAKPEEKTTSAKKGDGKKGGK